MVAPGWPVAAAGPVGVLRPITGVWLRSKVNSIVRPGSSFLKLYMSPSVENCEDSQWYEDIELAPDMEGGWELEELVLGGATSVDDLTMRQSIRDLGHCEMKAWETSRKLCYEYETIV